MVRIRLKGAACRPPRRHPPAAFPTRLRCTFELELEPCDDGTPVACVLRPLTIVVDQIVGNTPQPPLTPESPAPEAPATEPPGPIDLAELPFTGLDAQGLLALALSLLGAGAVLLRVGRSEP